MPPTKLSSQNLSKQLLFIWLGLAAVLVLVVVVSFSLTRKVQKQPDAGKAPMVTPSLAQKVSRQLIPDFPELPVYPGAILKSSDKQGQENQLRYEANWEVKQLVPQVMKWYVNTLSDGGWEIEEFPFDPGALGQQIAQVSEDEWRVYLTVEQEDEGEPTKITVEIVPKEFEELNQKP